MVFRCLLVLAAAVGCAACPDPACEQGPASFQVDLDLAPDVPAAQIVALEADVIAAGLARLTRLDEGPLKANGHASFVVVVGDAGAGGFDVQLSVRALGNTGLPVATGAGTFSASGNACNRFSLVLASDRPQDGGPPDIPAGADVGPDSGTDQGPTCNAASCLGCCLPGGPCAPGTADDQCGSGGAPCADCTPGGGTCQSNACVGCTPQCTGKICGASDGCGGTCAAGSGCTPCVAQADGDTLALYTMEGSGATVADVTGSHPGTLVGSGSARVTGQGGCGNALSFSGSSSTYMEVPDSSSWQLAQGSVDLWVRFDGATSDTEGIVTRDANGTTKPGHLTLDRKCNGSIVVRLQDSSGSWFQCSDPVSAQVWHHVAVNFGGSGGLELFVDGKLAQRTAPITCGIHTSTCGSSTTSGISGNNNPWVIGADSGKSSEGSATPVGAPLSGRIDSLRISSKRRAF